MSCDAGLYVHLPFCSSICPYCDFAVVTGGADLRDRYVRALIEEIDLCRNEVWPEIAASDPKPKFDSVFLGGGTPSLLTGDQIRRILDKLYGCFDLVDRPWIAMEANPEDVDRSALSDWKNLGVSYLSLGVQSFDPQALAFLGRHHTPIQARRSILMAKEMGFHTVSIDLIYCLPDQTDEAWGSELSSAVEMSPDHISCYQLTIEPGTPLGVRKRQGRLDEPGQKAQASLFFKTHTYLESLGYSAYEISNFASHAEHRSRHNQKYWTQKPYLGLGPSAHSFSGSFRWWNRSRLSEYLESIGHQERPIAETERLDTGQLCLETVALGFRTPEGIDLGAMPADLGSAILEANQAQLDQWSQAGLVEVDSQRIRPTLKGMALADTLSRMLHIPIA